MADQDPNIPTEQEIDAILSPGETPAPLDEHAQPIPPPAGSEPVAPREPDRARADDERLTSALSTIQTLQREVADLRGRPPQIIQQVPHGGEVPIEMEEVLPGRRIPKDPSRRAIKLGPEDLVRLGWNEDPARALNALANAFFHHVAEVIPQITMSYLSEQGQSYSAGQNRQTTFYSEFPDLRDFSDLAQIVENQALAEGRIQGMSQAEWNREIGGRVRQRIAAMRGVSLDQYTASVGQNGSARSSRPRTVTAPVARGSRQASPNSQQAEMDDLMDGRL